MLARNTQFNVAYAYNSTHAKLSLHIGYNQQLALGRRQFKRNPLKPDRHPGLRCAPAHTVEWKTITRKSTEVQLDAVSHKQIRHLTQSIQITTASHVKNTFRWSFASLGAEEAACVSGRGCPAARLLKKGAGPLRKLRALVYPSHGRLDWQLRLASPDHYSITAA